MVGPKNILLTDKVAIVTGGASGIGGGISSAFARFGANVVIADIDVKTAESRAADIRAVGREALVVSCDVMSTEQIDAAVARAKEHFGRIDILVNNVAGLRPTKFMDMSERSRARHVNINMLSMFTATQAAVAAMIERGKGGSVINITSIEGSRAAPRCAVYAACKAGMINFTRTAAVELAEHNVRVNAIAPDHVDTPGIRGLNSEYFSEKVLKARARYIPLGRDGTLDDIGNAAVFLASDMASYITGTTLNVDGGTFASSGWVRGGETGWTLFPD